MNWSTYYTIYCVLCLFHFPFLLELDISKFVFGTSSNLDRIQNNSCCFLLSELILTAFLRHWKVISIEFNMLIIKSNCVLYSGLVMKSNQVSKNIYPTPYCPITPTKKPTTIGLIRYKQSIHIKYVTSLVKRLMRSSQTFEVIQENLRLTSTPIIPLIYTRNLRFTQHSHLVQ